MRRPFIDRSYEGADGASALQQVSGRSKPRSSLSSCGAGYKD